MHFFVKKIIIKNFALQNLDMVLKISLEGTVIFAGINSITKQMNNIFIHHVYFWLKAEHQNDADRAAFEKGLDSLFKIGLTQGGRWAVPAKVMERPVIDQSWDYALTMQFRSVEDQDAYQMDPDHHVFIDTFKNWWAQVQVRDLA